MSLCQMDARLRLFLTHTKKEEPRSEFAARFFDRMARYYAKPSVCKVGLSTAEVTARPWSALKSCQRPARLRTKVSIGRSGIIPLLLQCNLDIHDDPIRRQVAIAVNRPVVGIVRVRVVTPGWIPVIGVPVPPPAQHKDDARVVISPPAAVMPLPVVIVERGIV